MQGKFYVTTPIYYVNDVPHIGHLYTTLVADVLARFHLMHQDDVYFLTGTDEHGSKIARAAELAGQSPEEFTNQMSAKFSLLADTFNVSNTDFIRTTEARHQPVPCALWEAAVAAGKIYKKKYQGLYCVGCEAFKTDKDLAGGRCPDHGLTPEPYSEENYFFRLSSFRDELLAFYAAHPNFVVPEVRFNEIKEMVRAGLEDVSVSRSKKHLSWGLPVPNDPDQVMYVWFDALSNYLSAIGFPDGRFRQYWPADVHVVAKDIARFHAVLWPAMLMAAGLEPPRQVAVHGFISHQGKKMSKTLGNVVDPFALAERYGVDPTRYFLLREIPFSSDGDYSDARLEERYESDLANGVGNLMARVLSMIEKYEEGKVPPVSSGRIAPTWRSYEAHLSDRQFHLALADVWDVIGSADKLIDDTEPWVLSKTDPRELHKLLYVLLETLRHVGLMLWPFMPETAQKILSAVGANTEIGNEPLTELQTWGRLRPGTSITRGKILFPRLNI